MLAEIQILKQIQKKKVYLYIGKGVKSIQDNDDEKNQKLKKMKLAVKQNNECWVANGST